MQTLKTAAIVVLLMTVMYGAYVSLTTPPEPLPPEVEELLVVQEKGLPESLALDIDTGSLATNPASDLATGELTASFGSSFGPDTAVTGTLSDQDLGLSAETTAADATEVAAMGGTRPNYPSTGSTFELPDPSTIAASLPASKGGPFASPDLALDPQNGLGGSVSLSSATSERASEIAQAGAVARTDTPPPVASGPANLGLANALRTADQQYLNDQRKEALATLSLFYNTPNLSGEDRSALLSRLDPLAREVVYSDRHLLEQAHRVGQGETLMEISERYEVPWQLLANINHVADPVAILPGTELKVVRGPFRAEVDLNKKELALFLGDLYAGRFPVGIGDDPAPNPGTFTVQDKQAERTYYDRAGSPVPPGSPDNPYGNVWIDLGGRLCIHGSPNTTKPTEKGCISLAADYADDLYGILSQGSSVTIRR